MCVECIELQLPFPSLAGEKHSQQHTVKAFVLRDASVLSSPTFSIIMGLQGYLPKIRIWFTSKMQTPEKHLLPPLHSTKWHIDFTVNTPICTAVCGHQWLYLWPTSCCVQKLKVSISHAVSRQVNTKKSKHYLQSKPKMAADAVDKLQGMVYQRTNLVLTGFFTNPQLCLVTWDWKHLHSLIRLCCVHGNGRRE